MVTRKKYSTEFKLDAISLVLEQHYTRLEAAPSLSINRMFLTRWIKEHESHDALSFRGKGKLTLISLNCVICVNPSYGF